MESIKANIKGQGVDSSVEFSVEEAISQQHGKKWGEMSEDERQAALKDYALLLYARQNGVAAEGLDVQLQRGSFSEVGNKDI